MKAPVRESDQHPSAVEPYQYNWAHIFVLALKHRPRLVRANLLAILATVVSVPIPLLLPVLVDEVLLDEAGPVLPVMQAMLPEAWHLPVVYIGLMVVAAFLLRSLSLTFNAVSYTHLTLPTIYSV